MRHFTRLQDWWPGARGSLSPLAQAARQRRAQPRQQGADVLPAVDAPAEPAGPAVDDAGEPVSACGWFESSLALRDGLAVREWSPDDWATAALYFAELAPSGMQ